MHVCRRDKPYEYGRFGTTRFTIFAWPLLLAAAALVGFVVGTLLQIIPAIGQIAAVGLAEAWKRYHAEWITSALTAAAVMIVFLVVAAIVDRLYVWWYAPVRPRDWAAATLAVMMFTLISIAWAVGYNAYRDAQANAASSNQTFLPVSMRVWLIAALSDAEVDRASLRATHEETMRISNQLTKSRERLVRLRALLEGAEPITKRDLAAAERNGRIEGVILGIVTSIVASYIFAWLPRPRGAVE